MEESEADDVVRPRRLARIGLAEVAPSDWLLLKFCCLRDGFQSAPRGAASGRRTPENSSDIYDRSWPLWFQMRDLGYEHMAGRAWLREDKSYKEVWEAIVGKVDQDLGAHGGSCRISWAISAPAHSKRPGCS
jgi:hypothetical protein